MTDMTPIFTAAIALISAFVSAYLIPYLRQKSDAEDLSRLYLLAKTAVSAAEQLFDGDQGATKKEYVQNFLGRYHLNVDEVQIDAAIESAVLTLHRQLTDA